MATVFEENDDFGEFINPWFFPSDQEYQALLEKAGFQVHYIELIDRPTPLKTGLREWLKIFANHVNSNLNTEQVNRFLDAVEQRVKPTLYSPEKGWVADYVRLRFSASKCLQ